MNTYKIFDTNGLLIQEANADGIKLNEGRTLLYTSGSCVSQTVAVISSNHTVVKI